MLPCEAFRGIEQYRLRLIAQNDRWFDRASRPVSLAWTTERRTLHRSAWLPFERRLCRLEQAPLDGATGKTSRHTQCQVRGEMWKKKHLPPGLRQTKPTFREQCP